MFPSDGFYNPKLEYGQELGRTDFKYQLIWKIEL